MPLIRTLAEDFALRNATVVWHGGMKSPYGGHTRGELLAPRDEKTNPIYRGAAPALSAGPGRGAFSSTPRMGTVADVAGVRQ
jgi:hypothetical protein